MATTSPPAAGSEPMDWTIADVERRLDGIPAARIRTFPAPGTATEEDVLEVMARTDRICELVDGILVEKVMNTFESRLASTLIHFIEAFLEDHDLGVVLAGDGFLKLFPKQVRAPDVSFICWERLPNEEFPKDAIWSIVPDLAVEIVSKGNSEAEMQRKVREYFEAGSLCVWIVDPQARSARVFKSRQELILVDENGALDAGDVLPGFELSMKSWFTRALRRAEGRRKETDKSE